MRLQRAMNRAEAMSFLREHQPLPPTSEASDEVLQRFDSVRRLLMWDLNCDAVPLLLGAIGEGDGHGIYPMVETTLHAYPDDLVRKALKDGLNSQHKSVRYWCAQFAAGYPSNELLPELVQAFYGGDTDVRIAAATAIEAVGTTAAKKQMEDLSTLELESSVKDFVDASLRENSWSRSLPE